MIPDNILDSNRVPSGKGREVNILAFDQNEKPVLLVEVKADRASTPNLDMIKQQMVSLLQNAPTHIPYAMLVDHQQIQIFRWDGAQLTEPIAQIPAAAVLSLYDPEFERKEIFSYYMERLVESWLRDVAYHWKSETPPGSDILAAIGLAERLHNGTTVSEAVLAT